MSSRSQVAAYLAENLSGTDQAGRQAAINQVAAWLKENGKAKEVKHLVQDVAKDLQASQGYVYATITTARLLSDNQRSLVEAKVSELAKAITLEAVFVVDPSIIGGIKIDLPQGTLDASIERKLAKIIENVG